jgi:hypothetical protein
MYNATEKKKKDFQVSTPVAPDFRNAICVAVKGMDG